MMTWVRYIECPGIIACTRMIESKNEFHHHISISSHSVTEVLSFKIYGPESENITHVHT